MDGHSACVIEHRDDPQAKRAAIAVGFRSLRRPDPRALMEPRLRRIDELLDDDSLIDSVLVAMRGRFAHSGRRGRYGTPAEVALRMLVLKHLKDLSYEQLECEVTGNLVYRHSCRIDGGKVPDARRWCASGSFSKATCCAASSIASLLSRSKSELRVGGRCASTLRWRPSYSVGAPSEIHARTRDSMRGSYGAPRGMRPPSTPPSIVTLRST